MVSLESRTRFRDWLLEELRIRRWTQTDLAERVGVSQSAVAKWLAPADSALSRLPTYASCVHLASALQLPVPMVLEMAGLEEPTGLQGTQADLTPLQQKIIAMVSHIPDPMLELLYHQLVPMVDQHVQRQLLESLREHIEHDNDSSETP
jgi:transcriptional regulator with XRE-family HTH domain